MLTKEQTRSERDAQKHERSCPPPPRLRWEDGSQHGGEIIPGVWLRRQGASHREADTVTPGCWREQVVTKLLFGGGYVIARLQRLPAVQRPQPCGARACVGAHTSFACVRGKRVA